jgi:hypothetical protein
MLLQLLLLQLQLLVVVVVMIGVITPVSKIFELEEHGAVSGGVLTDESVHGTWR